MVVDGVTREYVAVRKDSAETLVSVETRDDLVKDSREAKSSAVPLKIFIFGVLIILWSVCGAFLFASMGYGPVEIVYIMVQIITTVGYGDLVPESQPAKLGCAFIVLGSTLIVANLIMLGIDYMLDAQTQLLADTMAEKEEEIMREKQTMARRASFDGVCSYERARTLAELGKEESGGHARSKYRHLVNNFLFFLVCLLAGVLFFGIYEACTCSYSLSRVEGCVDSRCRETGGYVKTWIDAFYMSVVTITTVGFGDFTAATQLGRVFCSVWMLVGVGATVNMIGSFSETVLHFEDRKETAAAIHALFKESDEDGDGTLNKIEFFKLQLVQNGLATKEQFDSIMYQFDIMAGEDDQISIEEYRAYFLPDDVLTYHGEGGAPRHPSK